VLPLLARRWVCRYVVLAIALPVIARLCLFAARRIEQRAGATTKSAGLLRKIGAFSQRRSNRARGKDVHDDLREEEMPAIPV
jgi:hypothetical protein